MNFFKRKPQPRMPAAHKDVLLRAARHLRLRAAELRAAVTIDGKWASTDAYDRACEKEYEELFWLARQLEEMAE